MTLMTLQEFGTAMPTGEGRVLGLDIGTKTIGIALSDARRRIATPLETIRRVKKFADDATRLIDIFQEHAVIGLVSGHPLEMSGDEGPRAQGNRQILSNILAALARADCGDVPAMLWDERMSSTAVERTLIDEADMTRKRRREVIDRSAAAYILQGALDALNG